MRVVPDFKMKIWLDFQFIGTWAFHIFYAVYLFGQQIAAPESTQRGSYMFKFVFSAVVCAAMCIPATSFAQDCGCCNAPAAPCVKNRKKLKLVDSQMQIPTLKRVCSTDQCGCSKSKLTVEKRCITRKKLTLVDAPVDPCRTGMLKRLRGRLSNMGSGGSCGCGASAPAPAPCGCGGGAAVPAAAPAFESAPAFMDSAPIIAPTAAAPCCGG